MATLSFANRQSSDYRFTIKTLDDPALADIRQMVKNLNAPIKKVNKRIRSGEVTWKLRDEVRVLVRARGPRFGNASHTLMKNATHYDVYLGKRRFYE